MELTREILAALAQPFPDDDLDFLPKATSGGKALAICYIDARSVMNRLDAVVGPANWSFDYDLLAPNGKMVKSRLTVCGVTKCDAGEGDKEDEALKSAVSDSLKRAAVHFGIGRYLYYLPKAWAPYDSQRRTFTERPRISPAAVEHAVAICLGELGVAKGPRPAPAPQPHPRSQAAVERAEQPQERSVWTAGAGSNRPAPESSGDRKAADLAEKQRALSDLYKQLGGNPKNKDAFRRSVSEWLGRDVELSKLTLADLDAAIKHAQGLLPV